MVVVYLGIGSNLGNRRKNIRSAIKKINSLEGTKIIKVSRFIETEPVGGPPGQCKFLNAAAKINTNLKAAALLKELKTIEKELGRKKTVRFGPRTIDLDILFYGDRVIRRRGLKVPHPRIFRRQFVLNPLLEVI